MIRVGGRFRKTVGLLVWFVIFFGLIQEGSALGIKHYLSSHWTFSGLVRVRLLFLRVSSPQGEIVVNTVPIRWSEARYSLLGGLSVEKFEVGSKKKPAAKIEGVNLEAVRPLLTGTVNRVEVSMLDPAWPKLAASGEKKGVPAPFSIPLDIDIRRLVLEMPGGNWIGNCTINGEGTGETGLFHLQSAGPAGSYGELSGNWRDGVGECFLHLSMAKKAEAYLDFHLGRSGFLLAGECSGNEGYFGVNASGRWNESADILLWNKMENGRFNYLPIRVTWSKSVGSPKLTVNIEPGVVTIPKLRLGNKAWFSGGKIAVDFSVPPNKTVPSGVCVQLEGILHAEKVLKGYTRRIVLNLNYDAGGGGTSVHPLSAKLTKAAKVEKRPSSFFLRGSAEKVGRCQGKYTGTETEASADFMLSGEIGRAVELRGRARIEGLRTEFSGKVEGLDWGIDGKLHWDAIPNTGTPFGFEPLNPLDGAFSLAGEGLDIDEGRLNAYGSGAWKLSLLKGKTAMAVKNGSIYMAGAFVQGLDGNVSLSRANVTQRIGCDLKAGEIVYEGTKLKDFSLKGGGELSNMGFDFGVSLPGLEGRAMGRLSVDLSHSSVRGRLSGGTLSMLDKELVIGGISTDWFSGSASSFGWLAAAADIWGERVSGISGKLNVDGGDLVEATFPIWSGAGKVKYELNTGKKVSPALRLALNGVELAPLGKFIKNWVELPLEVKKGRGNGTVELPLGDLPEGIAFSVTANEADLDLGEGYFYGVSGTLSGRVSEGTLSCSSSGMSLEKGKVPIALKLVARGETAKLNFHSSEADLSALQNAVFDFLPEYLGYGKMSGRGSAQGAFRYRRGIATLKGVIKTEKGAFTSEDGSLVIRGVNGSLPISLAFGEGLEENKVAPEAGIRGKDYELAIRKVAYSVFTIKDLRVKSHLSGRKLVALLGSGRLWGGGIGGELSLRILKGDIAYSGKMKLKDLSLWEFCRESRSLEGALSGQFSGTLKINAKKLGLGRVRGLLDIEVDRNSKEKKRISRDFIVRIGGGKIRLILRSHVLTYDKASLKCGLDNGVLTFYNLELSHRANPLKSIMRKDISFELRIPRENSVNVWKLIEQIKRLGEDSDGKESGGNKG